MGKCISLPRKKIAVKKEIDSLGMETQKGLIRPTIDPEFHEILPGKRETAYECDGILKSSCQSEEENWAAEDEKSDSNSREINRTRMPSSSSSCCDLLRERTFKNKPKICNEDLLSNLPDDLLVNIIDYLQQDDLDVVSQVSQKMGAFATNARAKTKREAEELTVYKKHNGDICVNLSFERSVTSFGWRNIEGKNYYLWMEYNRKDIPQPYMVTYEDDLHDPRDYTDLDAISLHHGDQRRIPCFVFKCIRFLSDRFKISKVKLANILMDDQFFRHYESSFTSSVSKFDVSGVVEGSEEQYEKFTNWIASKSPGEIKISVQISPKSIRRVSFLNQLVENGNCKKVEVGYYDDRNNARTIPLPESLYEVLPKIAEFDFESFVVESIEHFMVMVENRLKLKAAGFWTIRSNKSTNEDQMRDHIKDKKELVETDAPNAKFAFKLMNLNWRARFNPFSFDGIHRIQLRIEEL